MLLLSLFSFLFYGFGNNLYFHSFPTRRSSDLYVVEHDAEQPYRQPVEQVELRLRRRAIGRAQPEHQQQIPRDRKSTRLNSSHRTISYAVFCLKKKNKLIISKIT